MFDEVNKRILWVTEETESQTIFNDISKKSEKELKLFNVVKITLKSYHNYIHLFTLKIYCV